jgi:hypothetical protein
VVNREEWGGGKVSSGAGMTAWPTKASISGSDEGRAPRHHCRLAPWLQSGFAALQAEQADCMHAILDLETTKSTAS